MDFRLTSLLIWALCVCSSLTQQQHGEDVNNRNKVMVQKTDAINEILEKLTILTTKFDDLEQTNKDLQQTNKDLLTKINSLEAALKLQKDLHAESEKSYINMIQEINEKLERQLSWNEKIAQSTQKHAEDMDELEKHCLKQNRQISGLHSARKRQEEGQEPVAFYAALSSNQNHVGYGQNIIFNNVSLNLGANYVSSHGIFVAPLNGIYVFSVTLMTEDHTDTHAAIYVNDRQETYMKLYGTEHQYDTMSQTAIYQLNKGDAVAVKHTEADKSFHGYYTYFSGFLLRQIYSSAIIG